VNENRPKSPRTDSEKIFQRYLESQGLTNYKFEPQLPESKKTPDFCLNYAGRRIISEVKEIDPPEPEPAVVDSKKPLWGKDEARKLHITRSGLKIRGGFSDPYLRIQRKIEEAWEKLRYFPKNICCIVLYDTSSPGPTRLEPWLVYGAMLGRLTHVTPYDPERGLLPEKSFSMFSPEGGEMRWASGEPHKTNISAILVLEEFPVGQYRFFVAAPRSDPNLSVVERAVKTYEAMRLARGTKRDASLRKVRVIVHENPFAARKLPKGVFCGPYDVRYGEQKGRIERISAGREIRKLEAQGAIPRSPLLEIARRSARKGKAMSKNR